jgi:hypothetical protein
MRVTCHIFNFFKDSNIDLDFSVTAASSNQLSYREMSCMNTQLLTMLYSVFLLFEELKEEFIIKFVSFYMVIKYGRIVCDNEINLVF